MKNLARIVAFVAIVVVAIGAFAVTSDTPQDDAPVPDGPPMACSKGLCVIRADKLEAIMEDALADAYMRGLKQGHEDVACRNVT